MPPPNFHHISFAKYQGTGNDFVVVDWPWPNLPACCAIQRMCDRRFGIGADGILLLQPPSDPTGHSKMILFNSDGSRPEMCGNGLRCAALHLAAREPARSPHVLVIDTDAGPRTCELTELGDAHACVRVDMGIVTKPSQIELDSPPLRLHLVSVGNPHAVLLDPGPHMDVSALGPTLSTHPHFPNGVNAGFARVITPTRIDLQVWERGAGLTLACGTGACAAVAAAWAAGCLQRPTDIEVQLPGGLLTVDLDPATFRMWLRGPADRVFSGEIPWPT